MSADYVGLGKIKIGSLVVADPCYYHLAASDSKDFTGEPDKIFGRILFKSEDVRDFCVYHTEPVKSAEFKTIMLVKESEDNSYLRQVIFENGKSNIDIIEYIKTARDFKTVCHYRMGVDSGQMGLFDYERYEESNKADSKSLYEACCIATSKTVGVVSGIGVVSGTTHGDGVFDLIVAKDENGDVILAVIMI
jgi:hypothetical protein